jgi:hypothetical protein
LPTHISLREIFEIYRFTLDGLREQSVGGEFQAFENTFPRDPLYIARGLEAAFGLKIQFAFPDFHATLDIPEERRDFLSFYEYSEPNHQITVYINTNKNVAGSPIVSEQTLRFLVLKELFNAVIRAAIHRQLITTKFYPDTVEFAAFIAAHLDWISEKFSVYAFEEDEYSPTVTVENAAELLAVMFLVNIPELYRARKALGVKPKAFWKIKDNGNLLPETETADLKFSLFEYEKYADNYGVKVRFVIVLVKTDFILKIVDGLKAIVKDIKEIFSNFSED